MYGCNGLSSVYSDYVVGTNNEVVQHNGMDKSEKVGDISAEIASSLGMPAVYASLVDKLMTVLSCFFFVWYGGRKNKVVLEREE